MDRNVIFISHATPEDNDFAIWLASRLKALGYSTWIDKKALIGGEKFWQEIDFTIRHKAIKLILVYSNNICMSREPGILKDGIYKELSLAESIGKKENLKDFIILINIDGAAYNLFIGADRHNQIPFHENWAEGLELLLEKLNKDEVPKLKQDKLTEFAYWYENEYITKNGIIPKSELYYSNFWRIPSIPNKFYMYQMESMEDAKVIHKTFVDFPVARVSNILTSFTDSIPFTYKNGERTYTASIKERFVLNTRNVIKGTLDYSNSFPTNKDSANHLKSLLTRVFHLLMRQRRMKWYELSNKGLAYFHTPESLSKFYSEFQHPYRKSLKRKKYIYGRYLDLGFWHYAMSCKTLFEPFICFNLKSHIIFTTDGFNVWEDKNKLHVHRRKKGKRFFNAEWRDMELTFLQSLQDKAKEIKIALNESFILQMPLFPEMYWTDFGYFEPTSKERFDILSSFEEEDYSDEEENYF